MESRVTIHALVPLLWLLVDIAVLHCAVVFGRRVRLCQILLVWCGQDGFGSVVDIHEEMPSYHSGSAAFGSFLIAVMQFVRVCMRVVMTGLKKVDRNGKVF